MIIQARAAVTGSVRLETRRLVLRRWREEDVVPMTAVTGDPEVMRWIRDGSLLDAKQTRSRIRTWELEWDTHGFGLFAVELKSTGQLAGFAGLSVPHFLPELLPAVEIGWRLGREHWGRGLASEAAAAVVQFGFDSRGLERIVSIIQVGNSASERVAIKLGMRPILETVSSGGERRLRVFELRRPAGALAVGAERRTDSGVNDSVRCGSTRPL